MNKIRSIETACECLDPIEAHTEARSYACFAGMHDPPCLRVSVCKEFAS